MLAEEANHPSLLFWGKVWGALQELSHPLKKGKEWPRQN